ncbi:MAG: hypothetical protein ABJQ70_07465 [Roseobacter sp.]
MVRFMNKTLHAYLDNPVAFGLIAMPFILGLGTVNPLAFWLSIVTGIAALILTILTDRQFGLVKILPYKHHLAVDFMVGAAFIVAPLLLGFRGFEAIYYWVLGATVLLVVALDNTQDIARVE